MKLERINTAKGFCAKRSQRIPELHGNTVYVIAEYSRLYYFIYFIVMSAWLFQIEF